MLSQTAVWLCYATKGGGVRPAAALHNSQQMDEGSTLLSDQQQRAPVCCMCCVPIACLRSHRPTNPCWLHAHLPNHRTGNQLPRQPQSPRACLSVKTNPVLHFTCTTFFIFPFIHSFMNLFQHLPVSFWEQTWCSEPSPSKAATPHAKWW